MKSVYVTDSPISKDGHGGGVVSYHELNALTHVSEVSNIYQRVGKLFYEDAYPQNPFMYDYYIASLLNEPEKVELAHFYGASFNLTAKLLSHAKKFATVPAHNLEESLKEWNVLFHDYWAPPPSHLTDDSLFRYLVDGLQRLKVVTPSTTSALYLKSKLNIDAMVIPHGTDIPATANIDRDAFRVFHLSQFGPDKGQIYLLQAWKKYGRDSGVLTMCCNGIVEQAVQGVPDLIIKQQITEQEKEDLYFNASVYVQPSVTEGWGLEVGEAMAHGTPVIVTEGVGAKDMVVDGRDGFIVPARDPDAIVDKLIYFHDNPMEVRRMGHNARITAERFSWDKIEAMYVKLYTT